jgi:hypothetical protein
MIRGFALSVALVALAGCAGVESAGRSAREGGLAPPPAASAQEAVPAPGAAPAPPSTAPLEVPPSAEAPVAAPDVSVATPPPAPPRSASDDVVVRGEYAGQLPPPEGDFRSRAQRNEDIRSWDQCVTSVQSAFERDPMRPQLDSPEEYCSRSLGMAGRDAIPDSRIQRRR